MESLTFSLRALYAALDAHRRSRGLSWTQAASAIRRDHEYKTGRSKLSVSTVRGIGARTFAEADGVIQMLCWLNTAPERFLSHDRVNEGEANVPRVPRGKILRLDAQKLHATLDRMRKERGLTWAQVARETGWGVASLTRLSRGGRVGFPSVMSLTQWLGYPLFCFTRLADR